MTETSASSEKPAKPIDLSIEVLPRLKLTDPLMIGSSHWTDGENVFKQLAPFQPAAATLKTVAGMGGEGQGEEGLRRWHHHLHDWRGGELGTHYVDGPPHFELWKPAVVNDYARKAQQLLPATSLGLSVLDDLNHEKARKSISIEPFAYVELNWKYAFRKLDHDHIGDRMTTVRKNLEQFLSVYSDRPLFVKFPPEAVPLLQLRYAMLLEMLRLLADSHVGLIVANTHKYRVPPSSTLDPERGELFGGVIVGDRLFIDTYNTLHLVKDLVPDLALVATGGILSVGAIVDVVAAGAKAVQLCTVLDVLGVPVINWLRAQLREVCRGYESFAKFVQALSEDTDERSHWKAAAAVAGRFRVPAAETRIDHLFRIPKAIASALVASLEDECSGKLPRRVPASPSIVKVPTGLKMVISRTSTLAFLLSQRCQAKFKMQALDCISAARFRSDLSKEDFKYDFAIMPAASLDHILEDAGRIPRANVPQFVGVIGRMTLELVGLAGLPLNDVERVFYFGGASALAAVETLLEDDRFDKRRPEVIPWAGSNLIPLLGMWQACEAKSAIIAKPPLTAC